MTNETYINPALSTTIFLSLREEHKYPGWEYTDIRMKDVIKILKDNANKTKNGIEDVGIIKINLDRTMFLQLKDILENDVAFDAVKIWCIYHEEAPVPMSICFTRK